MRKLHLLRILFLVLLVGTVPAATFAQVSIGISIRTAPPLLPVYAQPACPSPGLLWTPGYWAYGPVGYYWVPGVWVAPPRPALLWTPGYWAFSNGLYGWRPGFWGPRVGFYGGVNYGFGYPGTGFYGGQWAGNVFRYNTAYANVNRTVIHNTYINRTVNNYNNNHYSYNGPGGVNAQPTAQERAAASGPHFQPTANQLQHQQTAAQNRNQFASATGGRPGTLAMNRVNGARYNQQGRIAQGVASGQLNPRETQRLEGQEAQTNREIRQDRQENGGRLDRQQRQEVRQQQVQTGRHIQEQKHDDQRGPR